MPTKRYSTEQMFTKLRQAEVELSRRLIALNVETLFIGPGSSWENGHVESFNGELRDELLDREICYTLTKAKILIERWRREYNTVRPHRALDYRSLAPEIIRPAPLSGLTMSPALSQELV